jgi:hypothetical protein
MWAFWLRLTACATAEGHVKKVAAWAQNRAAHSLVMPA